MLTGIKFVSRKKPTNTLNDDSTDKSYSRSISADSHSQRSKFGKSSHHKTKKTKYEHIEESEVDFNINDDDLEILSEKKENTKVSSYKEVDTYQAGYLSHENSNLNTTKYNNDYEESDHVAKRKANETFFAPTSDSASTYNVPPSSVIPATPAVTSNRSVADLLRQRIKSKLPLSVSSLLSSSSSSSMVDANNPNTVTQHDNSTDYDTDMMNIIKIKKQIEIKASLSKHSNHNGSSSNSNNNNSRATADTADNHNNISLADLVAAEKLFNNKSFSGDNTYHNMDEAYAKNILRLGAHYKGSELNGGSGVSSGGGSANKMDRSGADEEDDIDMSLFQDRSSSSNNHTTNIVHRGNNKKHQNNTNNNGSNKDDKYMLEKQVQQEVKRYNQLTEIRSNCHQCNCRNYTYGAAIISTENNPTTITTNHHRQQQQQPASSPQHFYISKSTHVCLKLKETPFSILPNHCVLIPITCHVPSLLHCNDETIREIDRYKSCLSYQFQKDEKVMLVLESSSSSNSSNKKHSSYHTQLDIIPLPQSHLDEAIMYFKEAFLAMTHQGRLVELTNKRGLKKAAPVGFQYISVEWGERIVHKNNSSSSNDNSYNKSGSNDSRSNGNNKTNMMKDDDDGDDDNKKNNKMPSSSPSSSSFKQAGNSRTMSSTCTGLVFIFDRENEDSDNDDSNTTNSHQDFGLDVLAGMFEEDSYRIRRRMNRNSNHHKPVVDTVEERKRYDRFLKDWSQYDWTQYESSSS